ncbi:MULTISPECIES: hypothetical protein [Alicyclobacillus]|uniref:Uncharacterized protein n=1 Tax=Alicyclobacillus acidoterrestris (strain ATCC 49025 / DSM 3922 / CIP 106132 / NCIMB 13137 / GD3B) TaxID=1356854 RepID=T0DE50_ALIAG|nr:MULTISPECIES: hypothetical protein [Alicyclobacillus]EPZ47896.1 hypothetical protein N007_04875 [Alicyclobacillus acidoterrestris ATCC 49025]UNO51037.1 hypothetical protein K1I37_20895 [Alicyclobacillus acidoterrestris]GEO27758.1 hypothetical protein AAC03nite_35430 [Alicyclobacillus acidoterrestris]
MKNSDRLVKLLSLVFSVYSPLHVLTVVLTYLMHRRSKYILFPLFILLIVSFDGIFKTDDGLEILAGFAVLTGLYMGWVKILRQDYMVGSIVAYPIHPWLNGRVRKLTGYSNVSRAIYELHIDPRLERSVSGVKAGLRVARDAKQISQQLRGHTAVGTTYEGDLMQMATKYTGSNVRTIVRLENVRPWSETALFPKKKWDTFIWEF